MIPILFEPSETQFTGNGLGRLTDCVSCLVTEERNGIYECEFKYPMDGAMFSKIQYGSIIYTTHDQTGDPQPFVIYKRSADINGIVTFNAQHISYMLAKTVVKPFTASSCANAISQIASNCYGGTPFTFWTDKSVTGAYELTSPKSVRSVLGGEENSLLDVYGKGEFEWDGFTVKLHLNRGTDTDVTIRYGKNLVSYSQDTDYTGTYNAVVPYWTDADGNTVTLSEGYIFTGGIPGVEGNLTDEDLETITDANGNAIEISYFTLKTQPLDLSDKFEAQPSEDELRTAAETAIASATPWKPTDNITVNFVNLAETDEYAEYAPLLTCSLCDTISVYFTQLGVASNGIKIIKVIWNSLTEKYSEMELGEFKMSFKEAIVSAAEATILRTVPTKSMMSEAIDKATAKISGGYGGYIKYNYLSDGTPSEMLIMDSPTEETSTNIIRLNQNGIGFSTDGGLTYSTAWTIDGAFVADYITSGTLDANIIRAGVIADATGDNYWNLESGEFKMKAVSDAETAIGDLDTKTSEIKQTANGLEGKFTKLETTVTENGEKLEEVRTYVHTGTDGVTIAKSDSEIRSHFDNDELYFDDTAGTKYAWINTNGLGASELSIGSPDTALTDRWRIFASADGSHLSFTRDINEES